MGIDLIHQDCMEAMKDMEDNQFELAIVDPPYGIKQDGHRENNRGKLAKSTSYHKALWDQEPPIIDYFRELFRVSRNQIIWGGNHFSKAVLPGSSCWLVWDKDNKGSHFADCELAYTSFKTAVRMFKFRWNGMLQGDMKNKEKRIHPTQKPVALYLWLLEKYASPGDQILDTHLGSGSIAIACRRLGFSLTAYEIDSVYYNDAINRFNGDSYENRA